MGIGGSNPSQRTKYIGRENRYGDFEGKLALGLTQYLNGMQTIRSVQIMRP